MFYIFIPCVFFYDDVLKGLVSRHTNRLSFVVCTRNNNLFIAITRLCYILHFFRSCKIDNFQIKSVIFLLFLLKRDSGYTLEPPH